MPPIFFHSPWGSNFALQADGARCAAEGRSCEERAKYGCCYCSVRQYCPRVFNFLQLTNYLHIDKRDPSQVLRSTKRRGGMTCSLYKTSNCQRWTSREWHEHRVLYLLGVAMLIQYPQRFIGMSGGAIFHEMMLRLGVKHVCMLLANGPSNTLADMTA